MPLLYAKRTISHRIHNSIKEERGLSDTQVDTATAATVETYDTTDDADADINTDTDNINADTDFDNADADTNTATDDTTADIVAEHAAKADANPDASDTHGPLLHPACPCGLCCRLRRLRRMSQTRSCRLARRVVVLVVFSITLPLFFLFFFTGTGGILQTANANKKVSPIIKMAATRIGERATLTAVAAARQTAMQSKRDDKRMLTMKTEIIVKHPFGNEVLILSNTDRTRLALSTKKAETSTTARAPEM
jgi:hypothetical protein